MSWQATQAVLDHSESTGSTRLVLLAIAFHANDRGSGAWPAVATIQREANVARSTVYGALTELEVLGELEVERRGSEGLPNRYRVTLPLGGSGDRTRPEIGPKPSVSPPPSSTLFDVGSEEGSHARGKDKLEAVRAKLAGLVPDKLAQDAARFIRDKRKVDRRQVAVEEMAQAAVLLHEFNVGTDHDFALGPHLVPIVMRLRDYPSTTLAEHREIVRSACRVRWWERNGAAKRPLTPAVLWGSSNCFERALADAAAESAGTLPESKQRYTRKGGGERESPR